MSECECVRVTVSHVGLANQQHSLHHTYTSCFLCRRGCFASVCLSVPLCVHACVYVPPIDCLLICRDNYSYYHAKHALSRGISP